MKKSLFLTFCFSWIPGAAQMYQGYMKKGVSIMVLFGMACALISMVSIPLLAIPIPIIYAFSFFDAYNIRNKVGTEAQEKDACVWDTFDMPKIFGKINMSNKGKWIGIGLILVGAYILLNTVFGELAYRYDIRILRIIINTITNYLPTVLIAAVSIGIGFKLISRDK